MSLKNRYLANVTVGPYKEGDALTSTDGVISYYRLLFNSFDRDPPKTLASLNDEEVLAIVEAIEGESTAELDIERCDALAKAIDVKPTLSPQGEATRQNAFAFGRALPASFDNIVTEAFKAKDTTDGVIVALAIAIDPVLPRGDNGRITSPIPGTTATETIKDKDGIERTYKIENPDRWRIKIAGKNTVGSYYADALAQRPEGKNILDTLRQIDEPTAPDTPKSVTHTDGETTTIDQFKNMTDKSRAAVRSRWKSRYDYGVAKLRRAVQFCMQVQDMPSRIEVYLAAENAAGATAVKIAGHELTAAGTATVKTNKPILLEDKAVRGSTTDPLSVTAFLGYIVRGGINDPHSIEAKAVGDGATLQQYQDTTERAPKVTGAGTAKVAPIPAGNLKTYQDYLVETDAWTRDGGNWVLLLEGKNVTDEMLLSFERMAKAFDSIVGKHQRRLEVLLDKEQQEKDAEQAEKAKRLGRTG